jgi:hypothetical protein
VFRLNDEANAARIHFASLSAGSSIASVQTAKPVDVQSATEAYFKKKEEQLRASRPGSYDVVLRSPGLAHPGFSDYPLLFAGENGFPPNENVLHNLELIERYVREFLGKNLRGQKAPLLDSNSRVDPEATVQHFGH